MMKAQYFVYTRNFDNDYKLIIAPSEEFCPQEIRRKFLIQARGLINVEQFDDPLNNVRWLFSRINNFILWGIGTNNNILSDECNKDFTGRLVRGFFGIVIDVTTSNVSIPYDIDFFKNLYARYIVPLWMEKRENFARHSIDVDENLSNYRFLHADKNSDIVLNFDPRKSVILGDVDEVFAFQCALWSDKDTSVVTGFASKSHAFSSDYKCLNSIVIGTNSIEEKYFEEKKSDNRSRVVDNTETLDFATSPKKVLSPRLLKLTIALIAITVILMIILRVCMTHNSMKHQNILTSGDSITNQTNLKHSNGFPTLKNQK